MKKGYAIILDAIVALTFTLIILTSLIGMRDTGSSVSELSIKRLHYVSEDSLDVLNKKGILDEVGESWAAADGNKSSPSFLAANMTASQYLEQLVPSNMGYMLTIDDDVVAVNDTRVPYDSAGTLTHSTRLLVGYGKGLPTRGNVARAMLTNIKEKETSSYTYFGGFVGEGNVSVSVRDIPADAQVISCCLEMNTPSSFNLQVNGNAAGSFTPTSSGATIANLKDRSQMGCSVPADSGSGCVANCAGLINPGTDNRFDLYFTDSTFSNRYIGGGYVHVLYNTNTMDTDAVVKTSRYYFPGISGVLNLYDSFYIPGILDSMEANIHYKSNYSVFLNIGDKTVYNSTGGNMSDQYVVLSPSELDSYGFIKSTGPDTCTDPKCVSLHTVPLRLGTGNISAITLLDIALVQDRSGSMNQSGWTLNNLIPPSATFENVSVPNNGYSSVYTFGVPNGTARLAVAINWTNAPGYPDSDASEFVVNLRRPNGTWVFEYPGTPNLASGKVDPPYSVGNANEYYSGISTKPQTIYVENPVNGTWAVAVYGWNLRPKTAPPAAQNVTIAVYNGTASNISINPTVLSINSAMNATKSFVDGMASTDRGAYVVFGSYAQLKQGLTSTHSLLKTAIDGTGLEGGTYTDTGINTAQTELRSNGRQNATKIMILCTDGQADNGSSPGIGAAAAAKGNGTVIFAIGLTGFANGNTLQQIASQPAYYFYTPDASGLSGIYSQISNIISSDYRVQSVNVTGNFVNSELFGDDSYIEFNFVPTNQSSYGEVSLKRQTCPFADTTSCRGYINVPDGVVVSDAKVTSYSGQYWTNRLDISNAAGNNVVFSLSNWFTGNYLPLGDPYIVQVPAEYVISGGNSTLTIGTGYNSSQTAGCSADDRAIYTLRMQTLSGYGDVFENSIGCNWTMEFEDGTAYSALIPQSYNGTDKCFYTNATISYTSDDAINDAVYRLFTQLDLDRNGKIDLLFDPTMINFELGQASNIQSLWGPAKFKLVLWM